MKKFRMLPLYQTVKIPLNLLVIFSLCLSGHAFAGSKVPLARDGYRDSSIDNGHQNMPFKVYGVAIKWEQACRKGAADSCMRLAGAMEAGEGDLKAEIRVALGFYLRACEEGKGAGCTRAATIIQQGTAKFMDQALAIKTADRGCNELKDQTACAVMGAILDASGDSKKQLQAASMINTACASGADNACQMKAATLFYDREDVASHKLAVGLFKKACKNKQAWGCSGLAKAYLKGRGTSISRKKARSNAQKGCLKSEGNTISACSIYGHLLTRDGSSSDMSLGTKILAKACLAKNALACNDAGKIGREQPEGSKVARWEVPLYFRDACDLNLAEGCLNLAYLYESGLDAVKIDPATMLALKDKACRLGHQAACNQVGEMGALAGILRKRPYKIDPSLPALQQLAAASKAADQGDGPVALSPVVRLMQEGVAAAEWLLAGWLYYGYPGIIDQPRKADGFTLFENAARQGHIEAAKWVAMAYWYGDGISIDRKKGLGYMSVAAQRGDEMANAIYRSMKAEPVRQDNARRQQAMEAEAERRKTDWSYQLNLAISSWQQANLGRGYSGRLDANQRMAKDSWQRSQNALDRNNWNNAMRYTTGKSSVCPLSNPYC